MDLRLLSDNRKLLILCAQVIFNKNKYIILHDFLSKRDYPNYLLYSCWSYMCDMTPKIFRTEEWLVNFTNLQFFHLFRMSKDSFERFINVVGNADKTKILCRPYTGGHYPIGLTGNILVFLWYMATQDTLLSIGTRFRIAPSTVMTIINRMLFITLVLKKQVIRFPNGQEELQVVSEGFKNYPGVVGAIDGTHIFLKVEKDQQDSYIDRYRRNSINLMAICDAKTLFTYVFVGFPGSAHDSRVFENSIFYRNIERLGPQHYFKDLSKYHLIGDSAFALKTWLITPYRGDNLTRIQRHHNYRLSSERVKIEHTFGAYKGRWRRVQFINTYHVYKAIEIATSACVLHNFCLLNGDFWEETFVEPDETPNMGDQNYGRGDMEAKLKRDRIARELIHNN